MSTTSPLPLVEIGIIGGSGFYEFIENGEEVEIDTPYGQPSDKIVIGQINGKRVAFLPRHGKKHIYPPHKVPYRANIAALKQLGVKYIIGPSSCGSLQPNIKPGDFVICDQFIDRTWGRIDSYYHGPEVVHLIGAEPYCPTLRQIAVNACKELNIPHHQEGTVVVINGPRFSTRAESLWFTRSGFSVVNMTQYPEVVLAKEQEICYVNISLVTDYDAGVVVKGKIAPVDHKIVLATFKDNLERVRALIREIIKHLPPERPICDCREILKKSRI